MRPLRLLAFVLLALPLPVCTAATATGEETPAVHGDPPTTASATDSATDPARETGSGAEDGTRDPDGRRDPEAAGEAAARDAGGGNRVGIAVEPPISLEPALRPAPEESAAMRRWYRLYRQRFRPVKESWGGLLGALAAVERHRVPATCRDLERGLGALDPPTFLPVPDPTIDLHFKRTLGDLERVVVSCRRGRWFELSHRLEVARRSFVQTAALIRRYGLEP